MSDIDRERAIELIELMMREYEENECMVCDITFGDEELEALRLARDSLEVDEAYQLEYERTTKEMPIKLNITEVKKHQSDFSDLSERKAEDCISREAVCEVIKKHWLNNTISHKLLDHLAQDIHVLPSVLPKVESLTLEKAIAYLHEIGWMQAHDKALTEGISDNFSEVDCNNCKNNMHRGDGTTYCATGDGMCHFESERNAEDCISRADAIHAVSEALKRTFVEYEDVANQIIGKLPSVTPQEPFINKPCVSEKVCEHDKQMVLDKIRAEIEQGYCVVNNDYDHGRNYGLYMAWLCLSNTY